MKNPILLIEDNAELRIELQESLVRRGFDIRACESIACAQEKLIEIDPSVVLSDICLPDGDGARFYMEHKPAYPHAHWLLMSGNQSLVRAKKQEEAGVRDVAIVDKPVGLRFLIGFIERALRDEPQNQNENQS